MARRITRKELLKRDEVQEAAFEFGHWLEENWRTVATGIGVAVLAGAAIGGWFWYAQRQAGEAQTLLAQAQEEAKTLINEAIARVRDRKMPTVESMFEDVYMNQTAQLIEQREEQLSLQGTLEEEQGEFPL